MGRRLESWLDSYLVYTEHSEPCVLFRLWCGISGIASCLQRKCWLEWQYGEQIYPNCYVLLVGSSGSRKGTAMRQVKQLLDEVGIIYCAESMTREAFIRRFAESRTEDIIDDVPYVHSSLTIFAQEFVVFIGKENYRLIYDLTDIYDSDKTWTYETKHQNTDIVVGPYLNILGAITPSLLQTSLPHEAIGGGLTGRMILVYGERGKKIPDPFLTPEMERMREDLIYDLHSIYAMKGKFRYTKDFIEKHTEWYMKDDSVGLHDQYFEGYIERRSLHLRKLSMIVSASRSSERIITGEDFDKALAILTETEKRMNDIFYGKGQSRTASVTTRMLKYIISKKQVSLDEIANKFWADVNGKTELDNILSLLVSMKIISVVMDHEGNRWYTYRGNKS